MFNLWAYIYYVIITLVFLVPFGFCLLYVFISMRQWSIGVKENNAFKKRGALIAMLMAFAGIILVAVLWRIFLNY
jgi:hypothetical protein